MCFQITLQAKFLLTNVTCVPSAFIVWLQQMCLELVSPHKTVWTVSTWNWLCTSVNTNMKLQVTATFKQLPTVTTVIRSSVAVYLTFMCLQAVRPRETFVTQWTLVRFVSCVQCALCTLMWTLRSPDRLNALSHTSHLYGLSPVWTLMWVFRCPNCLNALSHMSHLYGFSSVFSSVYG